MTFRRQQSRPVGSYSFRDKVVRMETTLNANGRSGFWSESIPLTNSFSCPNTVIEQDAKSFDQLYSDLFYCSQCLACRFRQVKVLHLSSWCWMTVHCPKGKRRRQKASSAFAAKFCPILPPIEKYDSRWKSEAKSFFTVDSKLLFYLDHAAIHKHFWFQLT